MTRPAPRRAQRCLIAGLAIVSLLSLPDAPAVSSGPTDVYIVTVSPVPDGPGTEVARRATTDLGGRVGFVYRHTIEGFSARMTAAAADRLAATPGVASVEPAGIVRAYNSQSVRHIGGLKARRLLGLTGKGVTVAVIDSGIDYTHAAFGGAGTVQAYRDNDPDVIEPGTFPTAKVIAGYDFVGDPYDPIDSRTDNDTPEPDPDPLDVEGHGTHVAGTCCGKGVAGEFGRGVAPGTKIVALKVWGNGGASTADVLVAAYERALDPDGDGDTSDRVDVVSFSGGVTFGTEDSAESVAAQQLVDAGITFVAAAGNAGNEYSGGTAYLVGSPATAPGVIAVGATDLLDTAVGFSSQGPARLTSALKPDVSAPGFDISSAGVGSGDKGTFKSGTSMAAPHVSGAAALLLERYPDRSPGVIAALLMNRSRPAYVSKIQDPTVTGAGRVDVYRSARSGFVATPSSISFGRVDLLDEFDPVSISLDAMGDRDVDLTVGSSNKVHSPVGVEIGFSDDGVSFQEEIDLVADPQAEVWMKATPSDEEVPAHVQTDRWYERQIQAWGRIWAQGRTRASVLWQATLLPSSDMTAPAELGGSEDEATLDLEVAPAPGRAAAEIYPIAIEDPSGDGVAGADISFAGARSFAGPATPLPTGTDQRGNKWLRFVGGDEDIEEAIEFVVVLDRAYETSRALTASVVIESTDGERTVTLRKPLYESHWCRVTFGDCSGALRGGYPALHSAALSVVVDADTLGLRGKEVTAEIRVCGDEFSGDVLMPECDTADLPPLDVSGAITGDQGCGGWWWDTDCAAPLEVDRSELLVVFPNQLDPPAQLVGP